MNDLPEKVIWGIAILAFIPVIFVPAALPVAILIAVTIIGGAYAVEYFLGMQRDRRHGERAAAKRVRTWENDGENR